MSSVLLPDGSTGADAENFVTATRLYCGTGQKFVEVVFFRGDFSGYVKLNTSPSGPNGAQS